MADFNAVEPGTDLSGYARELIRMHGAVIAGGHSPLRPRPLVARSWSRVLAAGLVPDQPRARSMLAVDVVERRRRESMLAAVIEDLTQAVVSLADTSSQLMLVVADAEGVVLWRYGSAKVRHKADSLGFREGAHWTEDAVGTNAIGTALTEAAPVQLFSGEHFEQFQHPWYCTAAPIHDPRTGDLLGIVDLSGPALTLHPAVTALVATGVRLAEAQLWRHHEQRLERLRSAAGPALATQTGPAVVVDENGWVAHTVGVTATRRVAVPHAGRAVTLPGLGVCVAERLGEGWLLRPDTRTHVTRWELDLAGPPILRALGGESEWRTALSARHAEILVLLHLSGRRGMTVLQLSNALYGDPDHAVAVRAEVSRLRRVLGSVLASRPYRITESVDLTLALGAAERLADCDFLRHTAGPGLRTLLGSTL
ncbi:diguanylate cyclase [Nocardia mangyaensis]|uniref:Diguanylate cyclase n=1 Tax=Nocardia mangyaensis TaxID=2213200 RepID=A0A1J0W2D4_9NOCA|nr:GAF domain-containing protein [Nocardia mangyaensis]APE38437.1 diguanylate cyclase [Nocardia mangyaensis]